MAETRDEVIVQLRAILADLAARLGNDSSTLSDTDVIPDCGVVDSVGLIEFVMLIDEKYRLGIEAEDMTVDQLGSFSAIADFVEARRQSPRKQA
jgi:acyl carrier protein